MAFTPIRGNGPDDKSKSCNKISVTEGIYSLSPYRYRGIGIRIEDDVLITESGPEVLTAECPKEVEDIERLMNNTETARL